MNQIDMIENEQYLNCTGYTATIEVDGQQITLPACNIVIEIQVSQAGDTDLCYTIVQGKTDIEFFQSMYPGKILLTLRSIAKSEGLAGFPAIDGDSMWNYTLRLSDNPDTKIEDLLCTDALQDAGWRMINRVSLRKGKKE